MKNIGEDVAVDHPLVAINEGLECSPRIGPRLELRPSGFNFEIKQIVLTMASSGSVRYLARVF